METIKAHPYASGLVVVGVLAALWLVSRGGGGGTEVVSSGADPSIVAAGTAIQQAQIGSQTQLAALSIQMQAQQEHDLAAIEMAKIEGQSAYNTNTLIADLERTRIQTGADVTRQVSTLQSQVAIEGLRSAETLEGIRSSSQVEMNKILAGVVGSQLQAQSAMFAQQQQTIREGQCSGFFDCLF